MAISTPTGTSSAAPSRLERGCTSHWIAEAAALDALQPEWETLWRQARATPFQSPAWLLPWWKHIARGELATVAVRDSATRELVGLAPLYVHADDGRVRHLFPIGIATTDHIDALAQPGRERDVLDAIAQCLEAHSDAWDIVELPQLDRDALLMQVRWPSRWRCEVMPCEPNPVLDLPSTPRGSLASHLAYQRRRIARDGRFELRWADAARIPQWIDALVRLHTTRWNRHAQHGVLADAPVIAFHREAAPRLHERGLLRLVSLQFEERPVAMLYCLADGAHVHERRWYDYIGGFDPAFARFSPGTVLVGAAIDAATREGAIAFDFLRGAESYKYRWGARDRAKLTVRIQPCR